jgi:hypothetical protein
MRVALLAFLFAAPAVAQVPPAHFVAKPGDREFTGRMIARPRSLDEWTKAGRTEARARLEIDQARNAIEAFDVVAYVPQTDEYLLAVPAGRSEDAVAQELLATGRFRYVEPDWLVYPVGCPNDPALASQWHHDPNRMDSCAGWDIHTGDPTTVVGYCDTGIRVTHEDLLLHRVEGYNAVDQIWESNGGAIDPVHDHGTWVTGCGSGNGDNGVGISGVGWNLGHRMLRVSNSSSGSASLSVLQHAARVSIEAGDKVASVSYSGVDASSNLSTATYVKSIGGLMVWAAGNDARNLTFGNRDADDLIVAGATDENDALAYFSAYGQFVDVTAPGSNIYTTGPGADNDYDIVSGTSFACPLTAGLCALIWSFDPSLAPDDVEALLKAGCDDLGTGGVDDTFGYGRIDVHGALSQIALQFTYPNGKPAELQLTGGSTLDLVVNAIASSPVAGSGLLHVDDGSGWRTVAMADGAPGHFTGTFPGLAAAECGDVIQWYVSVDATDGHTYSNPPSAPATSFTSTGTHPGWTETVIADLDFETATGWTVNDVNLTDGSWDRGVPVDDDRYDPPTDFDGSGQCWLTDNVAGNSDVDGGPTRLTSPVYDVRGFHDVTVSYARWFGNDDGDGDRLDVECSSDGGATWVAVESVGSTGGWSETSWSIGDYVALTNQFQVRFSATDNPNDSITEAGVDAFRIAGQFRPLKLDIDPETVGLQDHVDVHIWTGAPGALTLLLLIDLDGVPASVPFAFTNFDSQGRFDAGDDIPNDPTIVGADLTFIAFGFDSLGKLRATNTQPLAIR